MSIDFNAGSVEFKDSAGTTNWSSADKNLLIVGAISSSFNINNKDCSSSSVIETEETNLGAVSPLASVIFGHYKIGNSVFSIGGDRTYYYANENMVNADAYQRTLTGTSMPAKHVWFRVELQGGFLKAFVFYRFPLLAFPASGNDFLGGTTVQVRALIGGFEF